MADAKISSPMTGFPPVPGMAPTGGGKTNEGSGLGPKGVDGGIPLLFIDEKLPMPATTPVETTMVNPPTQKRVTDKDPGSVTIDSPMKSGVAKK
jgi:hypothetical protein